MSPVTTVNVSDPGAQPGQGAAGGAVLVPVADGRPIVSASAPVAAAYLGQLVADRAIRLGSRTSPMAMAQANQVRDLLSAIVPGLDITISPIQTDADAWGSWRPAELRAPAGATMGVAAMGAFVNPATGSGTGWPLLLAAVCCALAGVVFGVGARQRPRLLGALRSRARPEK